MIDQNARNALRAREATKVVKSSIDDLGQRLQPAPPTPTIDIQGLKSSLETVAKALGEFQTKLSQDTKVSFPKLMSVGGKVEAEITKMPSVSVSNLSEVGKELETLTVGLQVAFQKAVSGLKVPATGKVTPQGPIEVKDWQDLLDGIEELKNGFNILINQEKTERGTDTSPMEVNIANFPPQMVPTPVTHVGLNGWQGSAVAQVVYVSDTATALPASPIAGRRSVMFYNESAGSTLYIGGSGVTTTTGFPIAPGMFSPIIPAGTNMLLYGVTAPGFLQTEAAFNITTEDGQLLTTDSGIPVRVLEVSDA